MFGVCYYPEHWPSSKWASDAKQMAELGIRYVRISEFAWSRMEPSEGEYVFDWLDNAIDTLAAEGLKVVLCTPTATPPKWLIDKWPEVLPVDPDTGRTRGFGSRRHYDFASEVYLRESLRITEKLASRYGKYPGVVGWQTDNELGCHDTTLSASVVARDAFRTWCKHRYGTIDALNTAWGNVFWSMEYSEFGTIELPVGAVTETAPAHLLAWRRFSSDCMIRFHDKTIDVIRAHAPDHFITHNFIPTVDTGVDNHALAAPLDFTSYDSYPLGRTEQFFADVDDKDFEPYMRTGHPDLTTYCLDQTRSLSKRGFWIMEQQPGPVNWASHNPRPVPGMVRFWTLEAFAHGAECVSYFRWRQAPFAQEQMHAGLLRPDDSKATAWNEAKQAIGEAMELGIESLPQPKADVAIVTSSESYWVSDIENQSAGYDFDRVQFDYYRVLRALGVSVDFVAADADVSDYKLVVAPMLPMIPQVLIDQCKTLKQSTQFVFGPRSGAKTEEFGYPLTLPPGPLQQVIPLRILSIETLRPGCPQLLRRPKEGYKDYESVVWREELEAPRTEVLAAGEDGSPAVVSHDNIIYVGTLTDREFLEDLFRDVCEQQAIAINVQPTDVRVQQRGDLTFAFNYGQRDAELSLPDSAEIVLGANPVAPHDVTVWKN
ncbi:MAG: beta-galactosidase [Gammaproteobacteria bacterium]